ncbi:endonuclease/exonuclease/phosphatase, putative [Medicago truncatula]|uniref:Endonuclease/exonuclease/phosphatase, putative n=1 Tax=Medicago truncatula TaxID=3880 RepID=G7ZYX0_MEDTR|nr:endonuclease/exonuclease/phosphatase, putative [Medicago truncatula]
MIRRRINFMCLQETKWVRKKAKELDSSGFKLWYTGEVRSRNGVGIIVDKEWKKDIVDVKRIGDRIIALKFVVEQDIFNVISAYAPHIGLECFEGVHGRYGLGELNAEGNSILDFSSPFDLTIANTCFRKREEHLITYKSGASCSQIDFQINVVFCSRYTGELLGEWRIGMPWSSGVTSALS